MGVAYEAVNLPQIEACTDVDKPYIFISYCHDDREEVNRILRVMEKNHFRFWYDEGITGGLRWAEVLHERIVKSAQFVCLLSQKAAESEYVQDEIHLAKKYGIHILTVILDDLSLRGGLEMILTRRQTLIRNQYSPEEFDRQLCRSLDRHTLIKKTVSEGDLPEELEQRYRIETKLGGGFSGDAFLAENKSTGGKVVIKHATADDSFTGKAIRLAYQNECRALARQISTQAPVVFDHISDERDIFLVESFVQGTPLPKLNGLTDGQIVDIFRKTAQILQDFHEEGVYHCDIKPEHIFVRGDQVFLVDFGACRFAGESQENHTIGTIHYAAPEQFPSFFAEQEAPSVDHRADIFALGKSLLFVLGANHGILEIREADETVILDNKTTFYSKKDTYILDVERYCEEVHPLLRAVVDKMSAEKADYRFCSMADVIACFDSLLQMEL